MNERCEVCGRKEYHSPACPVRLTETPTTVGRKDDQGKARWSLVPRLAMKQVVQVLMVGANRYGDHNWRQVENPRKRYYDAATRHITARFNGEMNDPDDNLPHLAHAVCCLLFLLAFDEGFDTDPDEKRENTP